MEVAQFKKEYEDFLKKKSDLSKILLGEFKEDYEVTKCLEHGDTSGGDYEAPICLKAEHVYFKKGDSIQATEFSFQDDGSGNEITGEVTLPYQNGYVVVPMSKINISGSKDVSLTDRAKIKNSPKTSVGNPSVAGLDAKANQLFFQKHKNHLLIAVALVVGYFAYKKFKK